MLDDANQDEDCSRAWPTLSVAKEADQDENPDPPIQIPWLIAAS